MHELGRQNSEHYLILKEQSVKKNILLHNNAAYCSYSCTVLRTYVVINVYETQHN